LHHSYAEAEFLYCLNVVERKYLRDLRANVLNQIMAM